MRSPGGVGSERARPATHLARACLAVVGALAAVASPVAVAGQGGGAAAAPPGLADGPAPRLAELGGDSVPRLGVRVEHGGSEAPVVILEVPAGWSLYAPDPGDAGLPLSLSWLPRGRTGAVRGTPVKAEYPEPEVGAYGGLLVRSYTGTVRIPVKPPSGGAAPVRVLRVAWALCRADLCVPGVSEVRWEASEPRLPVPPTL